MKRIFHLLLIIFFTACSSATREKENKIQSANKTCTSICLSSTGNTVDDLQQQKAPAIRNSLLERTGIVLTW